MVHVDILDNNELQNGFYAYSIILPHVTSREKWIKEWNKVQRCIYLTSNLALRRVRLRFYAWQIKPRASRHQNYTYRWHWCMAERVLIDPTALAAEL